MTNFKLVFSFIFFFSLSLFSLSCLKLKQPENNYVVTGLENLIQNYKGKLKGKNVGIVTNHTGVDRKGVPIWELIGDIPDVKVNAVFSPEHGLFGEYADGEKIEYENKKPLPILFSLYGKTRKPTIDMVQGIDIFIYDIQDVGTRFYTYISTMGLILEASSDFQIPVLILDRPNPLSGNLVAGPLLDPAFKSFVGLYPIPSVYGLTIGELAMMIVDKSWMKSSIYFEVIPMIGWKRSMHYEKTGLPWLPPSPNIPDLETTIVYPATVLFEATNISEGRGTNRPFRQIGAPLIDKYVLAEKLNARNLLGVNFEPVSFIPTSIKGVAPNPKYQNIECFGVKLIITDRKLFSPIEVGIWVLREIFIQNKNQIKINESSMNRLFGSERLVLALNNEKLIVELLNILREEETIFADLSQKYYKYN